MIASAARSRLFELRRERIAAHRSAELLEQKREALLRETLRRTVRRDALRRKVDDGYRAARRKLDSARVEIGERGVHAAALAQQPQHTIAHTTTSVMGIQMPHLTVTESAFRVQYGAAGTTLALDVAARAFHDLLTDIIALAEEDAALSRLRAAMRKTGKLLNALKKIVVPRIERAIRLVLEGIEEEERDEALRRTVWRRRYGASRQRRA